MDYLQGRVDGTGFRLPVLYVHPPDWLRCQVLEMGLGWSLPSLGGMAATRQGTRLATTRRKAFQPSVGAMGHLLPRIDCHLGLRRVESVVHLLPILTT